MAFFVGLDWAKEKHAVCVVDESGRVVLRHEAAHTAAGLEELLRRLASIAPAGEMPIAIERPSGLLVDILGAAGHPLFPLHPNAVKACRTRYKAAPGRTDPSDAYMLADILRTDGHRFRALKPLSDETRALRVLVRTRQELVRRRVALANQLRSLLESFWVGATRVFADIDSPIAINLVSEYPTPTHARALDEERLREFLKRHAYPGRRSAGALLERLRSAPVVACGELEMQANGEAVLALLRLLKPLVYEIHQLTKRVESALSSHADATTFGVVSLRRQGHRRSDPQRAR